MDSGTSLYRTGEAAPCPTTRASISHTTAKPPAGGETDSSIASCSTRQLGIQEIVGATAPATVIKTD
jgi:hypothetical protein